MRSPLSMTLLMLAGATAAAACGPNVILDGASTGTATGGSTGTAFGGASSTSSFGPGAGGGVSVAVGTAVGTGGVSVTSATSTGTGVMGACTDPADSTYLANNVVYPSIVNCALQQMGNVGGEQMCLEAATGLGQACVGCLVDDVLCSLEACLNTCASGPNGQACASCRNNNCAGSFEACSGLGVAPGATSCATMLYNGAKGAGWQMGLPADAFITQTGFKSYVGLGNCACGTPAPSGCLTYCDDAFSNGPPDFCNGAVASPQCLTCLENACGGQFMSCQAN